MHFDLKLKPDVIPKWDGNPDALAKWSVKVNDLSERSPKKHRYHYLWVTDACYKTSFQEPRRRSPSSSWVASLTMLCQQHICAHHLLPVSTSWTCALGSGGGSGRILRDYGQWDLVDADTWCDSRQTTRRLCMRTVRTSLPNQTGSDAAIQAFDTTLK